MKNTTTVQRLTADQTATIRGAVVKKAAEQNAAYPQYAGHWDGAEWSLVVINRQVKTKMGVAFMPGDVTLARPAHDDGYPHPKGWTFITAYSARNGIDTSIRIEWARPLI